MGWYTRPKLESYTLGGWQQVHIYKDPPASVHTRKYEPVSEGDVLHNLRDSDVGSSRLAEAVMYLPRGVNPMVDVEYGNAGGNGARTTHIHQPQVGNPYKAFRDGAFRPPLFTQDMLQPLSRQRYLNPAVVTNPVLPAGSQMANLTYSVDRKPVLQAISGARNTAPIQAMPTLQYRVALPNDIFGDSPPLLAGGAMRDDSRVLQGSWRTNAGSSATEGAGLETAMGKLHRETLPSGAVVLFPLQVGSVTAAATANRELGNALSAPDRQYVAEAIKSDDKQLVLSNLRPNFQVVVHDSSSRRNVHVPGTIQDKQNVAVQTGLGAPLQLYDRTTGSKVAIRNYQWKIIKSALGSDALVVSITPDQDVTQQTLRNLTLDAKVSGGAVQAQATSDTAGAASGAGSYESFQQRHTKDEQSMIHVPGRSNFASAQAQNHAYQGGASMGDRQWAASASHLRREARKARASDIGRSEGLQSSASIPTEPTRVLRLKGSARSMQV